MHGDSDNRGPTVYLKHLASVLCVHGKEGSSYIVSDQMMMDRSNASEEECSKSSKFF